MPQGAKSYTLFPKETRDWEAARLFVIAGCLSQGRLQVARGCQAVWPKSLTPFRPGSCVQPAPPLSPTPSPAPALHPGEEGTCLHDNALSPSSQHPQEASVTRPRASPLPPPPCPLPPSPDLHLPGSLVTEPCPQEAQALDPVLPPTAPSWCAAGVSPERTPAWGRPPPEQLQRHTSISKPRAALQNHPAITPRSSTHRAPPDPGERRDASGYFRK